MLDQFTAMHELAQAAAPHVDARRHAEGRRQATELIVDDYEHIPADLVAHRIAASRTATARADDRVRAARGWPLDAERIDCPVRFVWGTADRLLPWPSAAVRFREWLPHAEWVELDGVGHCPQLDVPLETAELILGLHGALTRASFAGDGQADDPIARSADEEEQMMIGVLRIAVFLIALASPAATAQASPGAAARCACRRSRPSKGVMVSVSCGPAKVTVTYQGKTYKFSIGRCHTIGGGFFVNIGKSAALATSRLRTRSTSAYRRTLSLTTAPTPRQSCSSGRSRASGSS